MRGAMKRVFLGAFLVILAVHLRDCAAFAGATVETPQTRATLIVNRAQVAPGTSFLAGLDLELKHGWHTYWRTPGDSGLAADIQWALPPGFTAGSIQWPPPTRVPTGDLMNFGYEGRVILPISIAADSTAVSGAVELKAHATWLACAEVCIPEEGDFSVPITVASSAETPSGLDADALLGVQKKIPQPAPWPVVLSYDDHELRLDAGPGLDIANIASAELFPDGEGIIINAAPQNMKVRGDRLSLTLSPGKLRVGNASGVLVIQDKSGERTGYEINAPVTTSSAGQAGDVTIWLAVAFAFLGGVILNAMPCVLPVLVMKVVSITGHPQSSLKRDSLIYSAGVVSAFTFLAAVLLILRAGGEAIGWGFQLQSPVFVTVLASLMLALGLNLSGVFPIGAGIMGIGQSWTTKGSIWGPYLTGILAVVVATPCTVPFMGTAVGFAFVQSPLVAIAIFEALALGLAFPYVILAFVPGFSRVIPRPGVWMERLKQILAFGLYGATAWLVWVLTQQLDPPGVAVVFAALLCVAFAAWSWGVAAAGHHRAWAIVAVVALVLCVAAVASLHAQASSTHARTEAASESYQTFTPERLATLRAAGKPVFVNFTAAWCITCLVNERIALSRPEVAQVLGSGRVAYLKGDWTNRDPAISAALHELGREGVPVYAVYPPNGQPFLLPQVLTPRILLDALSAF
jgi:thiol:disulfide interchange protein DsbD